MSNNIYNVLYYNIMHLSQLLSDEKLGFLWFLRGLDSNLGGVFTFKKENSAILPDVETHNVAFLGKVCYLYNIYNCISLVKGAPRGSGKRCFVPLYPFKFEPR